MFTKTSLTQYISKNTVITLKNLSHLWYEQVQRHTCDIAIQNRPFLSNEYTFLYLEKVGVTVPSDKCKIFTCHKSCTTSVRSYMLLAHASRDMRVFFQTSFPKPFCRAYVSYCSSHSTTWYPGMEERSTVPSSEQYEQESSFHTFFRKNGRCIYRWIWRDKRFWQKFVLSSRSQRGGIEMTSLSYTPDTEALKSSLFCMYQAWTI